MSKSSRPFPKSRKTPSINQVVSREVRRALGLRPPPENMYHLLVHLANHTLFYALDIAIAALSASLAFFFFTDSDLFLAVSTSAAGYLRWLYQIFGALGVVAVVLSVLALYPMAKPLNLRQHRTTLQLILLWAAGTLDAVTVLSSILVLEVALHAT